MAKKCFCLLSFVLGGGSSISKVQESRAQFRQVLLKNVWSCNTRAQSLTPEQAMVPFNRMKPGPGSDGGTLLLMAGGGEELKKEKFPLEKSWELWTWVGVTYNVKLHCCHYCQGLSGTSSMSVLEGNLVNALL